jgi:phage terminase large subunit-like protein
MQTYLNTLLEEAKNENDFTYDTTAAKKRINFIEKCIKQSKGMYTGKKMRLSLWQKAYIEALYSFKYKDTGKRRFTESLLLIARKNGKSTLMAALGMYELLCRKGQSVACLSNDDGQAKLIFEELDNMRMQIDSKNRITGKNQTKIYNKLNFSQVFRLTSKQNSLDGKNISISFFDEAHECIDDEVYQSGIRSMSAQAEPLMIICTTAGFVRDKFLDAKISLAHSIEDGEIEADYFLPWCYEQDSEEEIWQDSSSWVKANPSLVDGIKKYDFLAQMVERAKLSNSDRIHLLTKDFNLIQTSASASFLSSEQICLSEQDDLAKLKDIAGTGWVWCTCGVDLSLTTDLTAVCFLYKIPQLDNKIHIFSHYFIPKTKINSSSDNSAGADYEKWQEKGYITVVDGAEITSADVSAYILSITKQHRLRSAFIGYDRWQADTLVKSLEDDGFDTLPIRQGYGLSNAIYLLSDLLDSKQIKGITEIDAWQLGNLQVKSDETGSIRAIKSAKSKKIDGVMAMLMALEVYRQKRKELDDVWEN